MLVSLLWWVSCLLVSGLTHAAPPCDSTCQAAQRDALEQLYSDLGGPRWAQAQGWTDPAQPHCTWAGVRCCNSSTGLLPGTSLACPVAGGVAGLDLAANNATGPWPADALRGLADSLVLLNLRSNQLTGSIPSDIGDLTSLQRLYLDNNRLSGPLPDELGSLSNLTQFSAAANRLSGPLPASLASMPALQWLLLDGNRLSGSVDPALLQLPQLEVLNLQENKLEGQLPPLPDAGGCGAAAQSDVVWLC